MTPEEIQRAIEFLLDHDAKFAVKMDQISAKMDQIEDGQLKFQVQLGKLGDAVIAVIGMVGRVTEAQIRADARIAEVAAAQSKSDEKLAALAERLDGFILVVERYISEKQNGRNP
jgi:hypothetical protein